MACIEFHQQRTKVRFSEYLTAQVKLQASRKSGNWWKWILTPWKHKMKTVFLPKSSSNSNMFPRLLWSSVLHAMWSCTWELGSCSRRSWHLAGWVRDDTTGTSVNRPAVIFFYFAKCSSFIKSPNAHSKHFPSFSVLKRNPILHLSHLSHFQFFKLMLYCKEGENSMWVACFLPL